MNKRKLFIVTILVICLSINYVTGLMEDSTSVIDRSGREINSNQRPLCAAKKDYDFITEYKRLPEHRYVTEYKRFPEYRYSFGIGKRWYDDSKRNTPYSFGIGKRYQMENKLHPFRFFSDYLSIDNGNYPVNVNDVIPDQEENKRAVPARSYDFGVGKRNNIFSSIQQQQQQKKHIDDNDKNQDNIKSQIWEQN
ncbi:allatostatin A-like [Microplitis demolitor]|uniref:allatostatin A-like n=1 Tax=Microplitis demolitor TaxID=69319 RepID=UPI0004CCB7AE|nr:allatostatin A-like [Microplitis demolitor]